MLFITITLFCAIPGQKKTWWEKNTSLNKEMSRKNELKNTTREEMGDPELEK